MHQPLLIYLHFNAKLLLFLDCDRPLIQKGNNEISKVKFASSDPKSNPQYAAMNSKKAWCTNGKEQYLEVSSRILLRVTVYL